MAGSSLQDGGQWGCFLNPSISSKSADFAVSLILARRRRIRRSSSSHPSTRAVTGSSTAPAEFPAPLGAAHIQTETNPPFGPCLPSSDPGVFYTQARAPVVTQGNVCAPGSAGRQVGGGFREKGIRNNQNIYSPTTFLFLKCNPPTTFFYRFKIPAVSPNAGVK